MNKNNIIFKSGENYVAEKNGGIKDEDKNHIVLIFETIALIFETILKKN
jgi:hypothetical protein